MEWTDAPPHTSIDPIERRAVAHDMWPRRLIERRDGVQPVLPARVVWPQSIADVVAVVAAATQQRAQLLPFGAGSGVCGGITPTERTWIVDMKRMNRVVAFDAARAECEVEAGHNGEQLEIYLNARGFTLGHFPSSIYCSTVGGWVVTRSAGQLSSHYGKIEDMVLGVTWVDGRGRVLKAGIDDANTQALVSLIVGSEGAFGILARVRLRIHALPTHRMLRGFRFSTLSAGVHAMRTLMQAGEAPAVMRLYDAADAVLTTKSAAAPDAVRVVAGAISAARNENSGPADAPDDGPVDRVLSGLRTQALFRSPAITRLAVGELLKRPRLLNAGIDRRAADARFVFGIEGDTRLTARASALVQRLQALGAVDVGGDAGEHWLKHRHRVSYRMSLAFAAGAWVDTCEMATTWDKVTTLHSAVRAALQQHAVVMCHMSHAYVDGCSLYFTFLGGGKSGARSSSSPSEAQARYDACWERLLAVARQLEVAGSHHHGLGRSKLPALALSSAQRALWQATKDELDPLGLMAPSALSLNSEVKA